MDPTDYCVAYDNVHVDCVCVVDIVEDARLLYLLSGLSFYFYGQK